MRFANFVSEINSYDLIFCNYFHLARSITNNLEFILFWFSLIQDKPTEDAEKSAGEKTAGEKKEGDDKPESSEEPKRTAPEQEPISAEEIQEVREKEEKDVKTAAAAALAASAVKAKVLLEKQNKTYK